MPCDTIQLNSIDVGKMNITLLAKALHALGATSINLVEGAGAFTLGGQRCTLRGGKLIVREGSEGLADRLKVAYSREVVAYSAKRSGFKVREVKPNVFALVK